MGRAHARFAGRVAVRLSAPAWPRIFILAWGIAAAVLPTTARAASGDDYLAVTLGPEETIRDVAETYLGDPDLWPEILRASGIASTADLAPGMTLSIPVTEVSAANEALLAALGQIQKANVAGAQIFAPDEIGRALGLHEEAQAQRLLRRWLAARDLAAAAFVEATAAIDVAERARDVAAEALVTDRNGVVEGQRPEDLSWRGLPLRSILVEEEKVRTLSDSTAQITFRDASRLRLSANSNAVIRQMRFDPLSRREESKVSLIEGDFSALLSDAGGERNQFDVDIPEVEATIESADFWVSHAGGRAKFANYDDALVRVAANGGEVTLGRNEGTIVDRGERPIDAVAVLPAPELMAPDEDGIVHAGSDRLAWQPVEGAEAYWLEISADQGFANVVASDFGLIEPGREIGGLAPGNYYWRVSALDGFGLPGARSEARRFAVRPDDTPPFLRLDAPAAGAITRHAEVEVEGEAEPGAVVRLDGGEVAVDADGRFRTIVTVTPGDTVLTLSATDPAGNATTETRRIAYVPDATSIVAYDPAIPRLGPTHFLANGDILSLAGTTTADAAIEISAGGRQRAATVSDDRGLFRVNLPLAAENESFEIAVTARSGFQSREAFATTIDREPPAIVLDPLPRLTADEAIRIAGTTDAAARLLLDGEEIAHDGGRFDQPLRLAPGDNRIELIATDPAGNVRMETVTVRLDREPPTLVSRESTPSTAGGQSVLALEVVAADDSGLAKAAPFEVRSGDRRFNGYLRYNKSTKRYRGTVIVPEADLAAARLARIELEDDAGNRRVFEFDR